MEREEREAGNKSGPGRSSALTTVSTRGQPATTDSAWFSESQLCVCVCQCVRAAVIFRLHRSSREDKGLKCLPLLTEAFVRRSCSDNMGGDAGEKVKGVWAGGAAGM